MNILGPLAGGFMLAPFAKNALGSIANKLSFASLMQPTDNVESDADSSIESDPTSELLANVEALEEEIKKKLIANGIDLADPVTLGIAFNGEFEVRSAHMQAVEIEQLLNTDPPLQQRYWDLSQQFGDFELEINADT